ncbi:hypothetical protein Cni_G06475 [Canna indica]|uniref:Glycosyl transferase 64 domain-containing protein n=1 Tax=Canna indica TaxID=4628 RepID=A0AAQ3JX42_9LILI|nr:hypothetical protein Cni_G06475 [Canna indica]
MYSTSTLYDKLLVGNVAGNRVERREEALVSSMSLVSTVYVGSDASAPAVERLAALFTTSLWKKNDLLKQSVTHYASCIGVESISIMWSEPNRTLDSLQDALWQSARKSSKRCDDVELKFDLHEEDILNNRFKQVEQLETDMVFSVGR